MSETVKVNIVRGIVALTILLAWEYLSGGLGSHLVLLPPLIFSSPSRIAVDLYHIFVDGLLWKDISVTLYEAFYGLLLGMVSGFGLGLVCAYWPYLMKVGEPFLAAGNATPRLALAPLFLLWLGVGPASKVALVWLAVFFVVFYNTYQGAKSVDPEMIKAIRVTGATPRQVLRIVILPSVLSWAFAALRPSLGFALISAVGGEFVGANKGLGYQLLIAQGLLLTQRIYSILIILMVVGILVAVVSQRIEAYVLRWRPAAVI